MKIFIFAILAVTLHQSFAGTIKDPVEALELKEVDSTLDLSEDVKLEIDSKFPFSCECDNISRCMCCGHLEIPRLKINREEATVSSETAVVQASLLECKWLANITAVATNRAWSKITGQIHDSRTHDEGKVRKLLIKVQEVPRFHHGKKSKVNWWG
ncbi:hypothetical protein AVEN_59574-1 [Araneus ventricosus]|uniref:DUF4773 domain-containing protein n=1 Tax=Araneus ventricosus TaxID=182803 RepID=A0A4Y2SFP1_ARAVE|nr:hypothetical protein AVEN_59574-1 [Araneus ventricosus]